MLLLIGFVALAERFGLQTILGAFLAGVILRIVDPDATATHPHFRLKLEGIGYGLLIPVFFVSISAATGAALIGAGLLSVMLFPLMALMLLGDREQPEAG